MDPCPHAPVSPEGEEQVLACHIDGCAGADFSTSILRNILLAGIYDRNVQRRVLMTVGIEHLPIQEIIDLVEEYTISRAEIQRRRRRSEADRECYNNLFNAQTSGLGQCGDPDTSNGGGGSESQSARDTGTPSARISAARITGGSRDISAPADPRLEILKNAPSLIAGAFSHFYFTF